MISRDAIVILVKRTIPLLDACKDEGGTGRYGQIAAAGIAHTVGVDFTIFSYDSPIAFAHFYCFGFIAAIEYDLDFFPLVSIGIVLDRVADKVWLVDFVEDDVFGNFFGSAHAESGMLFA